MGVSFRVVAWLRGQEHDACHLSEEGLHRLPNGDIFAKALEEDRVVLTTDLDFGEIVATCGDRSPGVVIFRLRNTRVSHVIDRLRAVLDESSAQETLGRRSRNVHSYPRRSRDDDERA